MKQRKTAALAAIVIAFMMAAGLAAGLGGRAAAHDDADEAAHPAHVHVGSCDAPADVVFPLSDVGDEFLSDGTPTAGDVNGQEGGEIVVSMTTIKSSLADLYATDHAIVVHESAEAIQDYIACGNIGGVMSGTSDLPIALSELNGSGYNGVALLHDNGDGSTLVSVYVVETHDADDEEGDHDSGDDDANSDAGTSDSAGASVNIVNFAFDQPSIEITAGTTVMWMNADSTPHTVTGDGGTFQSGKLDSGAMFSFTFDTPGTYDYHCEFHANMKGTIVVK